jgi:hypothetical protein
MRIRSVAVAGLVAGAMLLSGCAPDDGEPTPTPTTTGPAATPVDPDPGVDGPAPLVLPDDAVLGLVGILTAPNGATADFAVIVHASLPHMVPEAADAVAATTAWCDGEVDDTVIQGRGFTFTTVEVSVTPRDGDWPAGQPLLVYPVANPEFGSTIVAGTGLRQVDEPTDPVFDDYLPHCQQPAVLDGGGDGILYLGIPQDINGANDAASFSAWAVHAFGLSAVLPGGLGESDVVFSMCESEVTLLGEEFGASIDTWADHFDATGCSVGGSGPN